MPPEWRRLIESIHDAPPRAVLAVTGGGNSALNDLLIVPGASRTVLEAIVPYAAASVSAWLGRTPDQYCCEETALAMASVAYRRAQCLETDDGVPLVGIGCTASIVSDRPKRGEHRAFIAAQSATSTLCLSLVLAKDARDREEEDFLVGRVVLAALAIACGLDNIPALELHGTERLATEAERADPLLAAVWHAAAPLAWSLPDGRLEPSPLVPPKGLLCGSFNPFHPGHAELKTAAEQRLAGPVHYELSLANVDKPPLDYLTIARRRSQFRDSPLALTHAPTFVEKARVFPGIVFVVGVDTAERIVHPRYYGGSAEAMQRALGEIRQAGCRFLVAGRLMKERFVRLSDISLPAGVIDLFEELPPGEFRRDVSSTELRRVESGV